MSTKLASDDVYSETSWWTMASGGGVRGVPKAWIRVHKRYGKQITRSTEPRKQRFSITILKYCIFCMSLFVNTPAVRSELCAWTVLRLTWSVVDKCNLKQISCLLKLLHGPRVSNATYSLSRGNLLKFTSLWNIHSRICATVSSHTDETY